MENGLLGVRAVHLVMMKETPKNPNVVAPENAKVDQMWHVTILEVLKMWTSVMVIYQAAEARLVNGQIGQNVPQHVVKQHVNGAENALVLEIVMV